MSSAGTGAIRGMLFSPVMFLSGSTLPQSPVCGKVLWAERFVLRNTGYEMGF